MNAACGFCHSGDRHHATHSEPLEAQREPVAIRAVLHAARQSNGPAVQPLQRLEHWAIVQPESRSDT